MPNRIFIDQNHMKYLRAHPSFRSRLNLKIFGKKTQWKLNYCHK